MKAMVVTLAAAGIAMAFAMPAKADRAAGLNGVSNTAKVEHTDISAQRRYYRRYYGPRYRPYRYWGPRYGYYRPYRYYRPYFGPGVSFGFWGGPRVGVWF
jgi:hypothetical protein